MKEGIVTEVEVVRWRDADTPIVRFSREFPVRLVDSDQDGQFNAPEKNTHKGKRAKEYVESLEGEKFLLFIPSKNPSKLTDILSFDRVLGELWFGDQKMTDVLIRAGYGEIK